MLHMPNYPTGSDLLVIEAQRAGLALACVFSSSDEFEADIIRGRRAAGIYGPKRHRKQVALAAAILGALAALLAAVLVVI
jgi:hypothetical protein